MSIIQRLLDGGPLPESLGAVVDAYAHTRQLRLAMEKEIDPVRELEGRLREHIVKNLSKGDDTGVAGKKYRAQIVVKTIPKIADFGVLASWIRKNDRFDMLQKRLSEKAVKDWWEQEDRPLPGVEKFHHHDVSVVKI